MSPGVISIVQCVTDTETRDISVEKILESICTGGKKGLRGQIEKIRDALRFGDDSAKQQACERKKLLPAVLWSGTFTQRKNGALVNTVGCSALIWIS